MGKSDIKYLIVIIYLILNNNAFSMQDPLIINGYIHTHEPIVEDDHGNIIEPIVGKLYQYKNLNSLVGAVMEYEGVRPGPEKYTWRQVSQWGVQTPTVFENSSEKKQNVQVPSAATPIQKVENPVQSSLKPQASGSPGEERKTCDATKQPLLEDQYNQLIIDINMLKKTERYTKLNNEEERKKTIQNTIWEMRPSLELYCYYIFRDNVDSYNADKFKLFMNTIIANGGLPTIEASVLEKALGAIGQAKRNVHNYWDQAPETVGNSGVVSAIKNMMSRSYNRFQSGGWRNYFKSFIVKKDNS